MTLLDYNATLPQIRKDLKDNQIQVYPNIDNHDIDEEEIEINAQLSVS